MRSERGTPLGWRHAALITLQTMQHTRLGWTLGWVGFGLLGLGLLGCGSEVPEGCDHFVEPGDDDQRAVQTAFVEAQDGETVCLAAGTFTLTDPVSVSGLSDFTLRGDGRASTTLDFAGQETGGDAVLLMNMTDVTVSDLAIRDAAGDGLVINGADGAVVRNVSVGWSEAARTENGKYAIYPVQSRNVLVEESETFGASDAGFYIGQVENCLVRNNEARGNVAAYEIENSVNCEVRDNLAEENVGGILVFELPGLPMSGGGTLIVDNVVRNNNVQNFAEDGSIVALLPTGTGMFVLAANDVEITGNEITGNEGTGVAVVSYGTVQALGAGGEPGDDFDPWAEGIWVHDNTFEDNGGMPGGDGSNPNDPLFIVSAALSGAGVDLSDGLEDILWDGLVSGEGGDALCVQGNGDASFRNIDVAGGFASSTTDLGPHDCAGTPRPPVMLGE